MPLIRVSNFTVDFGDNDSRPPILQSFKFFPPGKIPVLACVHVYEQTCKLSLQGVAFGAARS